MKNVLQFYYLSNHLRILLIALPNDYVNQILKFFHEQDNAVISQQYFT